MLSALRPTIFALALIFVAWPGHSQLGTSGRPSDKLQLIRGYTYLADEFIAKSEELAKNSPRGVVRRQFYEQIETQRKNLTLARGFGDKNAAKLVEDAIKRLQDKLANLSYRWFADEIQTELKSIFKDENAKRFLASLSSVPECLAQKKATGPLAKLFADIYAYYSNKPELNEEDCPVLRSAYSLWASSQDDENEATKNTPPDQQIPLYNVNAHNSSMIYWLREMAKGTIPPGGLPLLHADTHTDIAHIHDHVHGDHWADKIPVHELGQLLNEYNSGAGVSSQRIEGVVRSSKSHSAALRNQQAIAARSASAESMREQIEQSIRERVHHISQPLTGALAVNAASKLIMCMPPWSKELPRSEIHVATGEVQLDEMRLVRNPRHGGIVHLANDSERYKKANVMRNLKGTTEIKRVPMGVVDCNTEAQPEGPRGPVVTRSKAESGIPDLKKFFSSDEVKKGFILDIDLDVFVSEGLRGEIAAPVSFARTQRHIKQNGEHGSHTANNENDPSVMVGTLEMNLINSRIQHFFNELKEAKASGIMPKVITIADSTMLTRAIDRANDKSINDEKKYSTGGGNYTPSCLAFLLNYKIRAELKKLYPIK